MITAHALAALLAFALPGSALQADGFDSAYTSITDCIDIDPVGGAPYSVACEAYEGIEVLVAYSEHTQRLSFGRLGLDAQFGESPLRAGLYQDHGERVEWRLSEGRPFATIVGWRGVTPVYDEEAGDFTGETRINEHFLVVSALRPDGQNGMGACQVAYVDVKTTWRFNEVARRIAERDAPGFICGEDVPAYVSPEDSIAVLSD